MERKTIKIIAAVLCGLALGGVSSVTAVLYSRVRMDLRETCVAARDIPPRTKVEKGDIEVIHVPAAYLASGTYQEEGEIIGKYTEIQGMIPAGSPFYCSMLKEEKELPDFPSTQLKTGQSAYSLETDLARSGGGLAAGQRVDLYLTIERPNETPVTGCLFENVRIISLRDHQGTETSDPDSSGIPYLAVLAVGQKDLDILTAADTVGTLRMIPGSASYDSSAEARLCGDTELLFYVKKQAVPE